MTTEYDPYSDLPPIPPGDRIDLDDLQPEHFTITDADLAATRPAVHGLYQAVHYHLGYLGEEVVMRVTAHILLTGRDIIEQARNNSGDVTGRD
ncbi:Uncharacterised protein [Mycobacteroides abscessus subsp. massiliense]|uniref:hypothetical protein n=1 Tax=Mycobacteroides TaxID=670516 RepID=UPI00039BF7D8|nr:MULTISPECIES: hypothetical protein [Mycobacteroides]MBN7314905.1 hypothetical protein [Mycobacteroides abscessus subsp. abscessus]MBV0918020.1 hypothetical protein [Mycobacteroides chelonae]RIT59401.1 hypothetical protein D2E95_09430 [Mycobacteroides abscessus]RIU52489.1 hypothetical protein D2F02_05600 [Mycobacteroides abscessus]SHX53414.1 Uncharacterised protein [Mycobacteroides abscessus subsp. abscessus]